MLQVTNLRQFQYSVAAAKARLSGTVTKKYQQFVTKVFTDLVEHTPQWSGHLAANWNVNLTHDAAPAVVPWKTSEYSEPVHQMGDPEAVSFALGRAKGQISKIRWNTKVSFVNPVDYAAEVEANPQLLRPVNLVGGQVVLAQYIASKYSRGNVVIGAGT